MTVRILGNAPSLINTPPPLEGQETWCANHLQGYSCLPAIQTQYTRWFNLHSREHMTRTYPLDYVWYALQEKPLYFQRPQPGIRHSMAFPHEELQAAFGTRYFTCTVAWLLAFAIHLGCQRIELWGIEVARTKPAHAWERPCLFYWIRQAQRRGIEVVYPSFLDWDLNEAGDPDTYTGPLYGYGTKPELELVG